jgi:AAA domain
MDRLKQQQAALAPEWLLALMASPKPMDSDSIQPQVTFESYDGCTPYGRAVLVGETAKIRGTLPGGRNHQLFKSGCIVIQHALDGHIDMAEAVAELTQTGLDAGLDKDEVAKTVQSAKKTVEKNPRTTKKSIRKAKKRPKIVFQDALDALNNPTSPEWLVDGLIEETTTGALVGPSGAGKSFAAVDLALCVATGSTWLGRETKTGMVFYLAGEGHSGLPRRVRAWLDHHGAKLEPGRLFLLSVSGVRFDAETVGEIINEVNTLAEQYGAPVLIIVDTLARFLDGDENSARDMGVFVDGCDALRDRFGSTIMIIHHVGHDAPDRGRGSSAYRAAMDFELLVQKNGVLKASKLKEAEPPRPTSFEIEPVGESAVFKVVQERRTGSREVRLTGNEKLGIDTFHALCIETGQDRIGLEHWRERFYSHHTGDSQGVKKKAFQRAREGLVTKNKLWVDNDVYHIPENERFQEGFEDVQISTGLEFQLGYEFLQ